jgi:hypothetical protein
VITLETVGKNTAPVSKLIFIRQITRGDLSEINYWYRKHQEPPMPEDRQPKVGYIVPRVAAAWMVETNANTVLIEGLVSNPEMPSKTRAEAIEMIVTSMLHEAKGMGYKYVYVITRRSEVSARCLGKGGQYLGPHFVFSREL